MIDPDRQSCAGWNCKQLQRIRIGLFDADRFFGDLHVGHLAGVENGGVRTGSAVFGIGAQSKLDIRCDRRDGICLKRIRNYKTLLVDAIYIWRFV